MSFFYIQKSGLDENLMVNSPEVEGWWRYRYRHSVGKCHRMMSVAGKMPQNYVRGLIRHKHYVP